MYQQSSGFTRGAENIFHEIQDMAVHVLRLSTKYSGMQGVLQPLTMHCLLKSLSWAGNMLLSVAMCWNSDDDNPYPVVQVQHLLMQDPAYGCLHNM
jgi:hypothetical protein